MIPVCLHCMTSHYSDLNQLALTILETLTVWAGKHLLAAAAAAVKPPEQVQLALEVQVDYVDQLWVLCYDGGLCCSVCIAETVACCMRVTVRMLSLVCSSMWMLQCGCGDVSAAMCCVSAAAGWVLLLSAVTWVLKTGGAVDTAVCRDGIFITAALKWK